MILMNLAARLNERDEVNMHLNEELSAYDRITKENEEALRRKTIRIETLEKLLRKHKIAIPEELVDDEAHKREEERVDGVYLEGEMTYNITEKNFAKTQEEVAALREVNGQQQEQIKYLKEELTKKESVKRLTNQEDLTGYRSIGESIDFIMKGLQRKENTDMKSLISEIYKIKKVVDVNLQG